MIDSQVIAFMCIAAMLTLTPGADTMLVVRNVLRGGRQDGIITTCGICTGLFVHATLSALGVSVILLHSATAFHLVKYAGACYLVWLGIPSLWSAVRGIDHPPGTVPCVTPDASAQQHCFREGLLSNVLNPKVAVFYRPSCRSSSARRTLCYRSPCCSPASTLSRACCGWWQYPWW